MRSFSFCRLRAWLAAALPATLFSFASSCGHAAAPPTKAATHSRWSSDPSTPHVSSCEGQASNQPPPLAACGLRAEGVEPLIDDFADPNLEISRAEGRVGQWFVYTDDTNGCIEVRVDLKEGALSIQGQGFSKWGAGFGTSLRYQEGKSCLYDASAYSGVRFRARGNTPIRMAFPTKESSFASLGGDCSDGHGCYDRHGRVLGLSSEWQTFEIDFCSLGQEGWGTPFGPYNAAEALGFNFEIRTKGTFQIWLDDLEFIPKADSEKTKCKALCPMDQLPAGVAYDPKTTPKKGGVAGFSLVTFEQLTPDCGPLVRRYLVHAPTSVGSDPPIVLLLPGTSADAESNHDFLTSRRFAELSDKDGFVLVYANGAPGPYTVAERPNGGRFWLNHADNPQVDDRKYLDLVVMDLIAKKLATKKSPRFLAGESIGGGMALEAALDAPERYRGVAAIMPFDKISPSTPPPLGLERLLIAYTQDDPSLPEGYFDSLVPLPEAYARAMGVPTDDPKRTAIADKVQEGSSYKGTNAVALRTRSSHGTRIDFAGPETSRAVRAIEFDHAGHLWPTPAPPYDGDAVNGEFGFRNRDFDMSDEVWNFFKESL